MPPPRNIAPGRPSSSVTIDAPSAEHKPPDPPSRVSATDVIFVNGQAFNGRGYEVCGVANQRGRLCGRIGACPFHQSTEKKAQKRARSPTKSTHSKPPDPAQSTDRSTANSRRPAVRQMDIPPQKSRFKRSWTTEEHRIFLHAMRLHGKGKWKEIAGEVKTRTANQCQSHAQKYFLRQAKSDAERKKKSIHDVTEKDVVDSYPHSRATWSSLQRPPTDATPPDTNNPPHQLDQSTRNTPSRSSPTEVPLAPRRTVEIPASTTHTPSSASVPAPVNIAMVPEADNLSAWNPSNPPNLSNSQISTAMVNNSVAIPPAPGATHANTVSVVQNGSSMTLPVVLPMSALGNLQYSSLMPNSFLGSSIGGTGTGAVAAPPAQPKMRVTVHINGKLKGGMALILPNTLEQFFDMAKAKFNFNGTFTRVFTRSGGEITCLDEMCPDDMLWLSTGEDFTTPR